MPEGVFRVHVTRPGPEADAAVAVLREHATVTELAPGEYDAALHGHMMSGTAIAALAQVLDREQPGWGQHVELRPTDEPPEG